MKPPDEPLDARGLRFAIVAARFNHEITERLVEGALECFTAGGVSGVPVEWVPGSFELPLAARALAETRGVDAVVALGDSGSSASIWLRTHEPFRHVLVDEFQDSDPMQLQLLRSLGGNGLLTRGFCWTGGERAIDGLCRTHTH